MGQLMNEPHTDEFDKRQITGFLQQLIEKRSNIPAMIPERFGDRDPFLEDHMLNIFRYITAFEAMRDDLGMPFSAFVPDEVFEERSLLFRMFAGSRPLSQNRRALILFNGIFDYVQSVAQLWEIEIREVDHTSIELPEIDNDEIRGNVRVLLKQLRALIRTADISELLREKLMQHVSNIDRDIELERSKYEKFRDLFLDVCLAMNEGVSTLRPALDKITEIAAAIRKSEIHHKIEYVSETKALPPPTPDAKDDDDTGECKSDDPKSEG